MTREPKSPDRLFELVKLKELLTKYGHEIHFLQSFEQGEPLAYSVDDAVDQMLRDSPDSTIFDKPYG